LSGVFWVSNLNSADKLVDSLLVGETNVRDVPKLSKARAVLVYEDLCGGALVGSQFEEIHSHCALFSDTLLPVARLDCFELLKHSEAADSEICVVRYSVENDKLKGSAGCQPLRAAL
jgi:hypothetical protein